MREILQKHKNSLENKQRDGLNVSSICLKFYEGVYGDVFFSQKGVAS